MKIHIGHDLLGRMVPMTGRDGIRTLHCYASGRDGEWDAICLDLDIAVQGESFAIVQRSLQEAVALYLETVADLPEEQQRHLLHRPVPFGIRLRFFGYALRSLAGLNTSNRYHHQFTMPLAA